MRLLLRGGPVYAPSTPGATAMFIVDDTIAWIGPAAGADVHVDSADSVVDLEGALVAPAFVDAHVHHTATGMTMLGLDLRGVPDRTALLDLVSQEARRLRGRPVVGHGWDDSAWPDQRLPGREELDRASWGSVVYLSRVDLHSAIASSALVRTVPGLEGAPGLEPDGRLTGPAHHLVRAHLLGQLPGGLRTAAQRVARENAASQGIACLHEAAGPEINGEADLRALLQLAGAEPGPELVAYWGRAGGPQEALAIGAHGAAGDLFVDGSLGSRTALLRAPYADAPGQLGLAHLDADEVADHLIRCTREGVQAGFHAIGDAAIDRVVDGLAAAIGACGLAAVRSARHRVEHLSMADPEHARRLAEAGVVASVQPTFDALWGGAAGTYAGRLGDERAASLHDLSGLVRAGVSLAFGSDSPVTAMEPWEWVRAAVWHHTAQARISGRAAFAAATRGGWRAAGRDDCGVLAVGAPATYAVWSPSELEVTPADPRVARWSTDPRSGTPGLPRLEPGSPAPTCLATVLAGRPIFVAGDAVPAGGPAGT